MSENINLLSSPDFSPAMSTDEICVGEDATLCLTDVVNDLTDAVEGKANVNHTHSGYALTTHTHSNYAFSSDLELLEDVIATKANSAHTHSEYASSSHSHDEYATVVALDTLEEEVDGKANANHIHTEYASVSHSHDNKYAPSSHLHSEYSVVEHDHDEDYASINHTHNDYATTTALNEVSATVANKANTSHSHNDIYYTETEIDTLLANKANTSHTHAEAYDAIGSATNALTSANAYTDSKIDALIGNGASTTLDTIGEISSAIGSNQDAIDLLNSAIGNKANAADLTSHTGNTTIHITANERNAWNAKSNFSGNYNDLTNKPTIPSIDGLATEVYVDTQIGAIDIPNTLSDLATDSIHRLVTDAEKATWNAKSNFSGSYNDLTNKPSIPSISGLATETYVDEAVSSKANTSHTHTIANITNLQNTLDGKAASGHTHGEATATTAGLMSASDKAKLNGIASGANAYTLPTASSTLGGVKTTSTVTSTSGYTACPIIGGVPYYKDTDTTYSLSSFGVTATASELNYVDGATSNIQAQLNGKASSSHNHNGVYANASHSHTASAVGAVATTDIATVSEVEAYLGI